MDSKKRFSNRVDAYAKHRPSYPREAVDYLYEAVGFGCDSEIADIGAGTGIFSELLLERGSRVIAVEPNREMREAAERRLGGRERFRAVPGAAEETGLPDASADFIVCAQSFHWFDRAKAQAEFRRVLKPRGKAVLVWNTRLERGTPFREEYDRVLRTFGTDYRSVVHKNIAPDELAHFFKQGDMKAAKFANEQRFDLDGLLGRMLSSSYIPMPGDPNYEPMVAELRNVFERNQQNGHVRFDYETELYWGEVGI